MIRPRGLQHGHQGIAVPRSRSPGACLTGPLSPEPRDRAKAPQPGPQESRHPMSSAPPPVSGTPLLTKPPSSRDLPSLEPGEPVVQDCRGSRGRNFRPAPERPLGLLLSPCQGLGLWVALRSRMRLGHGDGKLEGWTESFPTDLRTTAVGVPGHSMHLSPSRKGGRTDSPHTDKRSPVERVRRQPAKPAPSRR